MDGKTKLQQQEKAYELMHSEDITQQWEKRLICAPQYIEVDVAAQNAEEIATSYAISRLTNLKKMV